MFGVHGVARVCIQFERAPLLIYTHIIHTECRRVHCSPFISDRNKTTQNNGEQSAGDANSKQHYGIRITNMYEMINIEYICFIDELWRMLLSKKAYFEEDFRFLSGQIGLVHI